MTTPMGPGPSSIAGSRSALARWLPGVVALTHYERGWLSSDIVAGIVLTAFLVPVGMGYAEAAGLEPVYGLYATIGGLLAYGIFGPSRVLVLGPDSSLIPIIAATVVPLAAGDPVAAAAIAAGLAVMSGAIATRSASATGPVSSPSSIFMIIMPVCRSPAMMARWMGAAPRQRGSSEAWPFQQPSLIPSKIALGRSRP